MNNVEKNYPHVEGFPERLNYLIYIKNDLTAKDVGKAVGISGRAIGRYLSGEYSPNLIIFMRLCSLFKVSPNWLLTGKE